MKEGLRVVAAGDFATVCVTEEVVAFIEAYDARHRAKIQRHMQRYAAGGGGALNNAEHFKNQGAVAVGTSGNKITVFAFKSHQMRVYGCTIPGTRVFVCTKAERKKQDQASKRTLKIAADAAWELRNDVR